MVVQQETRMYQLQWRLGCHHPAWKLFLCVYSPAAGANIPFQQLSDQNDGNFQVTLQTTTYKFGQQLLRCTKCFRTKRMDLLHSTDSVFPDKKAFP